MNATAPDRLPSALRFGDATLGCLAVWTVCANAAVLAGLDLDALIALFVVAGAAAVLALRWLPHSQTPPTPADGYRAPWPSDGVWGAIALAAASAAIVLLHRTADLRPFWIVAVALLAASCLREARRGSAPRTPAVGDARWLWGVAAAGAVLASVCHRPDADDALYLNLAVAAAVRPELPLLAADTLHGIEGLPLPLPVYRLHAIELLWAALARCFGLSVIDLAHVATPAIAGALIPLGLARLLRLLLPRDWGWGLAAALAFLLLAGGAVHGFGNFGFVRLQQGKAILLSVGVPWIAACALEFARAPSARCWARLAAVQIAALGLSASAVWLAPAVAGLALLSALVAERGSLRRIGFAALASAYPLAAGLAIRGETRALFTAGTLRGEFPVLSDAVLARSAIEPVLGNDPLASLLIGVMLLSGIFAATPAGRRFCTVFALGFLLFFWNPFVASWVAASITGPGTYWRVFWVLPLPILVAALATAPRLSGRLPLPAAALGTLACGLLLLWVPGSPVTATANGVVWSWPGRRIPARVQPVIGALLAHSRAGSSVLLPFEVSPWITGFEAAPTPLVVRPEYLGVLRARYEPSELDRRMHLARLVSGEVRSARAGDVLRKAIDDYALAAVGLSGAVRAGSLLDDALADASFERVFLDPSHALWSRESQPESDH